MNKLIYNIILLTIYFNNCFGNKFPDKDIVIIYTNDVHCAINETIGYPGLVYYKNEVMKKTPYVTLVDVGDHAQGGIIGSISKGNYIINIMNEIGYDIVIPGNHDLDYGLEQFMNFSRNLTCGYISCNFRSKKTNKLLFKPYVIKSYGQNDDVKVAFVGIITPESISIGVPTYFQDSQGNFIYTFDENKLYSSVQKAVNDARKEGADYVIAVGHLGERDDITEAWKAQSIIARTYGIDIFIDGHSHDVTECLLQKNIDGLEIPITQSGARLSYIGQVTIGTDAKIKTELIGPEKVTSIDQNINALIGEIESTYRNITNKVVGHINFNLTIKDNEGHRIIRNHETNLANLVSDAFLYHAKKSGDADISFSNGGNICSSLEAGDITFGDIINVLPYDNDICIIEVSGKSILDALEMSARKYPFENGGFLHPSGLTYSINPKVNSSVVLDEKNIFLSVSGDRRVYNVLVNGKRIDQDRKYKIIGDDYFLMENGDGIVFNDSKLIIKGLGLPNQFLIDYIKELGDEIEKYKELDERIIISDPDKDKKMSDKKLETEENSGERKLISSNFKLSVLIFIIYSIFRMIV